MTAAPHRPIAPECNGSHRHFAGWGPRGKQRHKSPLWLSPYRVQTKRTSGRGEGTLSSSPLLRLEWSLSAASQSWVKTGGVGLSGSLRHISFGRNALARNASRGMLAQQITQCVVPELQAVFLRQQRQDD